MYADPLPSHGRSTMCRAARSSGTSIDLELWAMTGNSSSMRRPATIQKQTSFIPSCTFCMDSAMMRADGPRWGGLANRKFIDWLKSKEIRHTWLETPGAHTWLLWRRNLADFSTLLFQQGSGPLQER